MQWLEVIHRASQVLEAKGNEGLSEASKIIGNDKIAFAMLVAIERQEYSIYRGRAPLDEKEIQKRVNEAIKRKGREPLEPETKLPMA